MKTTEQIAGPLRLAKKYMADGIFNHLVAILEKDWPCSFSAREAIKSTLYARTSQEFLRRTKGNLAQGGWAFSAFYPDPAPVVHFARRLVAGRPQLSPVFDRLAALLADAHRVWTDVGADAVISSTLDALSATLVEFATEEMPVAPCAMASAPFTASSNAPS